MDAPTPAPPPPDPNLPPPPQGYGPLPSAPPPTQYYAPPPPPNQGGSGVPRLVWIVAGIACGVPILLSFIIVIIAIIIGLTAHNRSVVQSQGGPKEPGVLKGQLA